MLIAIDASRATRLHRTGTEGYSLRIIRALIAQGEGHRFCLYFRDEPPGDLFPTRDQVECRVISRQRLWSHTGLGPAVRRGRPDVLFVPAHVIPWPGVDGVPAVVTIHDVGYLRYPASHPLADRLYLDWSTRHSVRVARRVIAVSQATADDLVRLNGVSETKIRVVYSGADENLTPVKDSRRIEAVRRRLNIAGPYILHVGSLHPRKNLSRLVEAFAALGTVAESLYLVLAGRPGWEVGSLVRRIDELGLAGRVILPGYVPEADLAALYTGARAYAFPSLYEGFGFPVLEAMACGVPVVCSNTSSLPELAGDAALMVDPGDVPGLADALHRILMDEALRRDLIARGFERVKTFSWEASARATLAVLVEAAS